MVVVGMYTFMFLLHNKFFKKIEKLIVEQTQRKL